jgi:uncharacterized membrane protein
VSAGGETADLRPVIRRILTVGVVVSCLLLIIGTVLVFASGGFVVPPHSAKVSLRALPAELARGEAAGFLLLGVLVLVFTPFVRVLFSIGIFAIDRDVPFTAITLFVIAVLLAGLLLGVVP